MSLQQEIEHRDASESVEYHYGVFGEFGLVGSGERGSPYCGNHAKLKGCLRVDLHKKITLDGKDYSGKVYYRSVHFNCGKPSCPICYKYGWAVQEAGNIERRLIEAAKRFGQPEHIVAALPPELYDLKRLAIEELRRKAVEILFARGVIGGVLIFHGFRYANAKEARRRGLPFGWRWSPHFHCIGFIHGGYGCRGCKKCHKGCGGFVDTSYRCHEKDDWIVKVKGKRKTVFGTAWYILNHATLKVGVPRFHVATWFGVCSYRKLKVTPEKRQELCPICQHELTEIRYLGSKRLDLSDKRGSFEDYEEGGQVVFVVIERVRRWDSGSYEE